MREVEVGSHLFQGRSSSHPVNENLIVVWLYFDCWKLITRSDPCFVMSNLKSQFSTGIIYQRAPARTLLTAPNSKVIWVLSLNILSTASIEGMWNIIYSCQTTKSIFLLLDPAPKLELKSKYDYFDMVQVSWKSSRLLGYDKVAMLQLKG